MLFKFSGQSWPCRAIASCAPFLLLIGSVGCRGQDVGEQIRSLAMASTGADFCSETNIIEADRFPKSKTFNLSHVFVSAKPDKCAIWSNQIRDLTVISGQIDLSGDRIPLLLYANAAALDRNASIKRVVIRTIGGPGEALGPYGYESAYIRESAVPTIMVSLGYSGTAHFSLFPKENFSSASNQISTFVDQLCRKLPNASFLLIGESLGGPITVSVAQNVKNCGNRLRSLLVSPMVDSVSDQLNYTDSGELGVKARNAKKLVRVSGRFIEISSRDLFSTFFPADQITWSLDERIRHANGNQSRIWFVFGSSDTLLNPDSMMRFANEHRMRTTMIAGMGHVSGTEFESVIANVVEGVWTEPEASTSHKEN